MRSKEYFNHLSTRTRIGIFFRTKRRRFLYIFLFALSFNYIGNVFGFIFARLERSARKYKKDWILKYNPNIMSYQSALDTTYEPIKLSQDSTDKLSEAFLKTDRLLKEGVSRLIILRVLDKVGVQ